MRLGLASAILFGRSEAHLRVFEGPKWEYHSKRTRFSEHVRLVSDLFFELTRAANLVCDRVRETIFPGYRLKEGVVLIERHSVGWGLKTSAHASSTEEKSGLRVRTLV